MADYVDEGLKKVGISASKPVLAAICIASGIMVMLLPNLLVLIVGLFLVVQGAFLLIDYFEQGKPATANTASVTYCYSCGMGNMKEAMFCKRCGTKLLQAEQVVATQPREATPQAVQ